MLYEIIKKFLTYALILTVLIGWAYLAKQIREKYNLPTQPYRFGSLRGSEYL